MFSIASFCGNILAGASSSLPPIISRNSDLYFEEKTSSKVNAFIINHFGAVFGIITYKALTMIDKAPLHHPSIVAVSLVVTACGALYTRTHLNYKEGIRLTKDQTLCAANILSIQIAANAILAIYALYDGEYTFSLSALLFTSFNLEDKPGEGLEF